MWLRYQTDIQRDYQRIVSSLETKLSFLLNEANNRGSLKRDTNPNTTI
jgi:hypothetical protein